MPAGNIRNVLFLYRICFLYNGNLKCTGFGFHGEIIRCSLDEQIVYNQLGKREGAIWSLLLGGKKAMNVYMNRVALQSFSYFDTADDPSFDAPERFYHGFVLGLIVELSGEYVITSKRKSGFGRYDVIIEPKDIEKDAIILEFKVHDKEDEKTLEDTVKADLDQIEDKDYAAGLIAKGFTEEKIRKYGFAFEGKKVLIG